jgi:hypothetical protein
VNEELGAPAGHEDLGVNGNPLAAELHPAKDMFEGQSGSTPVDQARELGRRPCGVDEQPSLVLGEDAPRGLKPGDEGGVPAERRRS